MRPQAALEPLLAWEPRPQDVARAPVPDAAQVLLDARSGQDAALLQGAAQCAVLPLQGAQQPPWCVLRPVSLAAQPHALRVA